MVRTTATTAPVADETAEVDELDGIAEVASTGGRNIPAPDERIVERLKRSNDARLSGAGALSFTFKVANEAKAKARVKEIRNAGEPQYVNCGVSASYSAVDGGYEVTFKARKRRGSDDAPAAAPDASAAE